MKLTLIKYVLIGFIVGAVVGGLAGWKQKSLVIEAEQKSELVKVRVDEVMAVDEAYKTDAKLDAAEEKVRTEIKYITKEITKYVPDTIIQSEQGGQNNVACPSPTLNFGALSLLNAARTGESFYPAEWSDAEIQTHTEIGLQELSIADAELAEEYRNLALRHDELVDSVTKFRAEQLKRLNQ